MTLAEGSPKSREKQSVAVRKTTKDELPALTAAMARAFDDDPMINWMARQDSRRARRVYDCMAVAIERLTFPYGEVYTTDEVQGGACWTPPGKWKLGMLQQLMLIPSMVKTTSLRRIPTVMAGMTAVEKHHPHDRITTCSRSAWSPTSRAGGLARS